MKSTMEMLHECSSEQLGLSAIAARLGVHPVNLAKTFKRVHGTTIGAYARRLRVERAIQLLERSTLSLSAIAAEAGFYDQSHMGRLVKRATGLSPAQLRYGTAHANPVPRSLSAS
jgi:AraC family transcriptional regulator